MNPLLIFLSLLCTATLGKGDIPRQPDGKGAVVITGELKQWHNVTLTLDGPFAAETDGPGSQNAAALNPFTDLAFDVTFTHESGTPSYKVPGYFAADGNAANTGAGAGIKWRAHLTPDKTGKWNYVTSFRRGKDAALEVGGESLAPFDGSGGSFQIAATDKTGRDFRSEGRLQYVGKHHLQFAGSKRYFLKAGADAPETLLGYLPKGGTTDLDLSAATGSFVVKWFNPRSGGALQDGPVKSVRVGSKVTLGNPPADASDDWLVIVRKL